MDCTFVYNDTEVFYNAQIRFRGSPFIRSGSGRDPRSRYAYRIEFGPDQKFGGRQEINLDNTEGANRGPLQERASYWFYSQMGLQYSSQEFVRPLVNGRDNGIYEDVQKIDGDYIAKSPGTPCSKRPIAGDSRSGRIARTTTGSICSTLPSR
jgi:hypothetical protein